MTARTTTVLGQTFAGRPKMNSPACRIWLLEQEGKTAEAEALLRAYRMLGQGDLSGDFTDLPMEGVEITPTVPYSRVAFDTCPQTQRQRFAA